MVGGRADLRRRNAKACIRAGIVGGKFYVALDENDKVVGTAVWYPAGKDFLADEKQQREGASELLAIIEREEPELHKWWMSTVRPVLTAFSSDHSTLTNDSQLLPLTANTTDKFMGNGFRMGTWKLYSLTVAEGHRRKGIARMLVKMGEDQAAALGLPVCIEAENEHNMGIYKRLGYQLVGHTSIPGPSNAEDFSWYCLAKHFGAEERKAV
ncbi:hypothetical protein AN958_11554 [Leucoagaricus sp. SymC.cos]|nr:hypothetical protein AN958_11554 [Leucoagaricus sp. SymC.cos]